MGTFRFSGFRRTSAFTVAGAVALALVVSACSSSGGSSDAASSTTAAETTAAATDSASPSTATSSAATTSLKGVCPDTVVIQSSWMPVAEKGALYQLVGPNGTVDTKNGSYNGPLGNTGVNVSIRSGGPFLGNQSAVAALYSDDSVLLTEVSTDDAISMSGGKTPVVAVMAPMDKSPKGLIWDPTQYQFTSVADAGKAGIKILKSGEDASTDILIANGTLQKSQMDYSWDGSLARFITAKGKIAELDYVTQAPYKLETSPDWGKKTQSLLLADAGYTAYENALVTTPAKLTQYSACFKALVPMIQQAGVNFITNPTPMVQPLIDFANKIKSLTPLSAGLINFSVNAMKQYGVVENGTDGTFGSFDTQRINDLIKNMAPVIKKDNWKVKPGLTADDLVTNQFLDPSIAIK